MAETVTDAAGERKRRHAVSNLGLGVASFVAGIALWWVAALFATAGLPTPLDVVAKFGQMIGNGQLFIDIFFSLRRVLAGFLLGAIVAIPVGFLMGWYRSPAAVIEPLVQFFRMIPPLAIIPLAIVTMGIGETPKIFVIFLASFLSVGHRDVPGRDQRRRTLINAAGCLGAGDGSSFAGWSCPRRPPSSWSACASVSARPGRPWWPRNSSRPSRARVPHAAGQLYYDLATIFVA